jgi:Zn-finger protein
MQVFDGRNVKMCNDCTRLHEQLQQQSEEMYGLRKRITRLYGELRYERKSKAKLLKEKKEKEKQHVRKGQKRSRFGRI